MVLEVIDKVQRFNTRQLLIEQEHRRAEEVEQEQLRQELAPQARDAAWVEELRVSMQQHLEQVAGLRQTARQHLTSFEAVKAEQQRVEQELEDGDAEQQAAYAGAVRSQANLSLATAQHFQIMNRRLRRQQRSGQAGGC